MQNLLAFISKYYYWALFIILEAISITLLFSYNSYQSSVWFSSANTIAGQCYEWESEMTSFLNLKATNELLTTENTQLSLELAEARKTIANLKNDTLFLKEGKLATLKTIDAKVVQSTLNRDDNLITINKGTADGVKENMGVISGSGVVGIVYMAGKHYSVVLPILNSQSNISCRIRGRGYFGYLRWQNHDSQYAYVEDVPRHAHYRKNDVIETSGYSSVFPEGISVGKIICTFNSADGLSYRIKIKLSTDFSCLRNVAVIDNTPMQEQLDILRAANDSLAARQ